MTLPTALAASCDTYFYERRQPLLRAAAGAAATRCRQWARRFGFGKPAGLDIGGEAAGLVPTPEWRKDTYKTIRGDRAWNPGDSIQLAIGQKDLLVTPLQMTRFYTLLANGGKLVTPYVVADVEQLGSNGSPTVVLRRFAPDPPQPVGLDSSALGVVREGLRGAASLSFGTSVGVFGSFPVPVAGKTGTAEKWNSDLGRLSRPVLVVRLGTDGQPRHRRLRADRERRLRRGGGGAGGAAGVRGVLRGQGGRPGGGAE